MRRICNSLALVFISLSVLAALATASVIATHAELVQRVQPYPEPLRVATGQMGTDLGEPVNALIFPTTPILERRDGKTYVDASIVYPLQTRSVQFAGYGGGAVLLALGLLALLARRFVKPPARA